MKRVDGGIYINSCFPSAPQGHDMNILSSIGGWSCFIFLEFIQSTSRERPLLNIWISHQRSGGRVPNASRIPRGKLALMVNGASASIKLILHNSRRARRLYELTNLDS